MTRERVQGLYIGYATQKPDQMLDWMAWTWNPIFIYEIEYGILFTHFKLSKQNSSIMQLIPKVNQLTFYPSKNKKQKTKTKKQLVN